MFYKTKVKDFIRVSPEFFSRSAKEAVSLEIKKQYAGFISKDMGIVIDVYEILDIKEGIVIPGDGAGYFETEFYLITYKPELQEVICGTIKDIADYGAFMTLGPIDGMIHVSQTMDDFVSFSKDKVLLGKESKKSLKVGEKCKARIIAVSYKDVANPKIGLTMRQEQLGKLEWIKEVNEKKKAK